MKDAQKPDHVSLNTLLGRVKEGRYVIPDFQREFEWSPWDIRDLVRSIFLDYYIGSLLLWKGKKENFDALSCESIYGFTGKENPEVIVLDGQQRLTALYYVFTAPDMPLPNRSRRAIYYLKVNEFMAEEYDRAFEYEWLSRRWVTVLKDVTYQYENHIFPLSVIGAGGWELPTWMQGYTTYWKDKSQELSKSKDQDAYEKAKRHAETAAEFGEFVKELTEQYQISYIELDKELSVDKICDIFTQINSRGVRLDVFDLVNALLKPKGLQLKSLWREAAPKLEFVDTAKMNVYILQVMSIIRQAYCSPKYLYFLLPGQEKPVRGSDGTRGKEILVANIEDFEKRWLSAVSALENAIKLLKHPQEFGAIKSNYLPYVSILPIFASLQAHAKALPAAKQLEAQKKIRHWYWASVFTNRYSGSVESTSAKDFLDIKAWIESDDASPVLLEEFKSRFRSLDLRREIKRGTSIYNGIFNLLILNGARDWSTGNVSQGEDLDDHHIVPASWGYKKNLGDNINTILNRTPLTAETNRQFIGDRLPNDYLPELIKSSGEERVKSILEAHFISAHALDILLRKPFTPNDFQDFITERYRTILDGIESLLIKERINFEPKLRELDEQIEKIELALRVNIATTLEDDPKKLPSKLHKDINDRIAYAARKNAALDINNYQSLQSQMEYFNLLELRDVIIDPEIWPVFKELYKNEATLQGKFKQLAELRNSIRHSKTVNEIIRKEGEASIIWFTAVLDEYIARLSSIQREKIITLFEESEDIALEDIDAGQDRTTEGSTRDTSKYDVTIYGETITNQAKRNAIYYVVRALCNKGVEPEKITALIHWKTGTIFSVVQGKLTSQEFMETTSDIRGKRIDWKRYFYADEELFYSNGKTFAFTKMWGSRTAEAMRVLAKEFPDAGIEYSASPD